MAGNDARASSTETPCTAQTTQNSLTVLLVAGAATDTTLVETRIQLQRNGTKLIRKKRSLGQAKSLREA